MRKDDALAVLIEFDHLEVEFFVNLSLRTVFLNEVLGSSEAFYAVGESNDCALIEHFDDSAFVNRTNGEDCLEYIPGIFFELLVAEAQAAVVLVDSENLNFDVGTDLSEFAGVFDFLGPGEVADVDKTVDAFFDFNEYAEVGEVAYFCSVTATDGIFCLDVFPRIVLELLDAEAHLAVFAVESEDNSFNFVADFHEVLSAAEMLRPRHFADVDKTFYARSDFEECAVIGHNDHFALDFVADFEVGVEGVPGMGLELLETESDTFLLVVEVEDNDVEFLVELDNFAGMVYAAPREVGDVDKTVDATEIDEYAVSGDILDCSFENLTLFELGYDLALLLLELSFDKSFVRNDNVFEFLVDLDNFEFHCLAYEEVVVADGLDVDLRAGEECLDAEYVDNHAAFCAALDVALDDFVVFESRVDTFPRA